MFGLGVVRARISGWLVEHWRWYERQHWSREWKAVERIRARIAAEDAADLAAYQRVAVEFETATKETLPIQDEQGRYYGDTEWNERPLLDGSGIYGWTSPAGYR